MCRFNALLPECNTAGGMEQKDLNWTFHFFFLPHRDAMIVSLHGRSKAYHLSIELF